jgi:hypothetical protein
MSQAHNNSRLILKNQVTVVDFSSTHFDFNHDAYGIQYGDLISANSGAVYTTRDYEGKFGGGIAVEESTTNLMVGKIGTVLSGSTVTQIDSYTYQVTTANVATSGITFSSAITNNGATKTFSGYIKGTRGVMVYMQIHDTIQPITLTGRKDYFSITGVSTTNLSLSIFTGYVSSPNQVTTFTLYNQQTESKPFATSFVNGTRASGILNYPASILETTAGTMTMWVRFNGWSSIDNRIFDSRSSGTISDYHSITIESVSSNKVLKWYSLNSSLITGATVLNLNQWYMITATWDSVGNIRKLYINGVLEVSGVYSGSLIIDSNGVGIGGYTGGGDAHSANAIIDEVRIDNSIANAEEILAWYVGNVPFENPYDDRVYAH